MLEQTENYKQQVAALKNIITKLSTAPDGWLWADDKPCEDMPGFFTNTIYKYCTTFFNAEQDEAVVAISETMIKNFPADIRFYSLAASSYAAQKKYDKAVSLYEQALKIDPKDIIVLHNLAYVYSLVPDRERSIFYYNEIIKYGNEEDKKGSKIKN